MAKKYGFSWMNPGLGMDLAWQMTRMTIDAQNVIALRLAKIAKGGKAGQAESILMVEEKLRTLGQSQMIALRAAGTQDGGAARIAKLYGRKVAANRRRLSRGL
ncbi:MAG: hypothetical protein B7Z78_01795 [Rhodospirillales bacterium 20-60-12]|nr:MAG: hypothetical protein B7Z78_01795 [Rhodospirillales bacterium 20-60-12]